MDKSAHKPLWQHCIQTGYTALQQSHSSCAGEHDKRKGNQGIVLHLDDAGWFGNSVGGYTFSTVYNKETITEDKQEVSKFII